MSKEKTRAEEIARDTGVKDGRAQGKAERGSGNADIRYSL